MKTIKSIPDLERLRDHPLHSTLKDLFAMYTDPPYTPEDDGYLVLIEPDDVDRVLDDLDMPWKLSEVPFEGVHMVDGCFYAVYIPNNQFTLGLCIGDEDWLPDDVRRHLEDHLDS